jgi:hypothetical protein
MTGASVPATYQLTRFLILRLLGLVYSVAFLVIVLQFDPLLGSGGLLPAASFLERVRVASGSTAAAVVELPTLFWFACSDRVLHGAAWIGLVLSVAVLLGATNALLQLVLWALYLSFVHVGQLFYGYGWETQLCETGALAVFVCPISTVRPFPRRAPPVVVIWLFRWLIIRIMLGAAAIKLRGDPCWRDFSCLVYHYETQPIPNPVSWWLHARPRWFHVGGVAFNHFVELVAPFLVLGPRRLRLFAGVCFVAFQIVLIISGNLSFLNWLTIVPALACFDDRSLARLFPPRLRARVVQPQTDRSDPTDRPDQLDGPTALHRGVAWAFAGLVAVLSVNPVLNLLSPQQAMNRSYDPLSLVNTYGAFGAVGRERDEIIIEGTRDAVIDRDTEWKAYEFPCKPGDLARRPCAISPYHYRLDWQLWFAAMSSAGREPWLLHLVAKLLEGDPGVKRLLAIDPFPDTPPRFVRILRYRYRFTRPGDGGPAWWQREYRDDYLRSVGRDDPELQRYLGRYGW